MKRENWAARRVVLATLAIALAGCAAAQTAAPAPPPTAQAATLWSILLGGLEWPAWFILAGSIAIIAIITEHFISIRAINVLPVDQARLARQMIEQRRFRDCLETVRGSETFFASVLTAALLHGRHGFTAMHEAAVQKSSELTSRMFRRVEYMNIIGNLGPLMGLLGTVWGMIIAFKDLGGSGGAASAGDLARGISLALVNTLLGLSLAIIGLGFFGWCRNRVDALTVSATVEVLDLLEYFRPAPTATEARSGAAAVAPGQPRAEAPAPGIVAPAPAAP